MKDKNNDNFQHLNRNMVLLVHTLNPNSHRLNTHDKNQGYGFLFDLGLGGSWLLWKTFGSSFEKKIGTILILDKKMIQELIIQKTKFGFTFWFKF